ncbi:exodeoxyribonuclease VII small subunit [candidate division TA06 bacterium]|uniref:Exodeoxyribonuclease 7 small subunit n=1 Tax=candidate division TA06 bacterium TaxID=2250710 RepID=A0A933I9N8_UNCT6|nr:exodeoxyribonuclease VII small subunit [candidate division TA06 bacterium]
MKTAKKSQPKDFKLEAALKRLEQIVEKLESGEVEIDQALGLYQEGMELLGQAKAALNEVNFKIKKLTLTGQGEFKTEAMKLEEGSNDQE